MEVLQHPPGGDVDRASAALAVAWIGCVTSLIFVISRVYCRMQMTRNMWWDDHCMCLTMILAIIFSALYTVNTTNGGARHRVYLSSRQLSKSTKFNWLAQAVCISAIGTGKVSVAVLIGRIMGRSRWRKWALYFLSIASLALAFVAMLTVFIQCTPTKALWSPHSGRCWNPESSVAVFMAASGYDVAADVALALIPVTIIWRLQLDRSKRIGLSILLGLGVFAAICAAVRTAYLPPLAGHSATLDSTWITVDLLIWTSLEVNFTIIAACIPTVLPLYNLAKEKLQSSYPSSSRRTRPRFPHHHEHDRHTNGLHKLSTKIIGGVSSAKPPSPWHYPGGDDGGVGRSEMLPYNRIREVIEMDVVYEDRKGSSSGREDDGGEITPQAVSMKSAV